MASEPLLLLSRDFGSRQLFDAACRIAQLQPRVVLESREPHSLIALAEAGQGVAIVPSTVRFVSKRIRIVPLLQDGKSLGAWGGLAWDPRRSLPGTRRASSRTWQPTFPARRQENGSTGSLRHCFRNPSRVE